MPLGSKWIVDILPDSKSSSKYSIKGESRQGKVSYSSWISNGNTVTQGHLPTVSKPPPLFPPLPIQYSATVYSRGKMSFLENIIVGAKKSLTIQVELLNFCLIFSYLFFGDGRDLPENM